MNIETGCT